MPVWPVYIFPYIFLTYMALGGLWLYIAHKRRPGVLGDIALDLAQHPATRLTGNEDDDGLTAHIEPGVAAAADAGAFGDHLATEVS